MRKLQRIRQIFQVCSLIALLVCVGNFAWSQGTAVGRISGTVTDTSGAVIAGANVTIVSADTNDTHTYVTHNDGAFTFPNLPPGLYNAKVDKAGFGSESYSNLNVGVGSDINLGAQLKPGREVQTVTVEADAVTITEDSGNRGVLIQPETLNKLPLQVSSGPRQDDTFETLSPGVTGNTFAIRINGGPIFSQDFLYDGIPYMNADGGGRQEGAGTPVDAVDQYAIDTNPYGAEFGRGVGALNFRIRSGTNKFHAAGWEYLRNNVLDSRGHFSSVATEKQNEYGGRVGGPIRVPHVYNGTDKSFFFLLFNWYKFRGGVSTSETTLPTDSFIKGDFSALLNLAHPVTIYDPLTTTPDGSGSYSRTAFTNNVIDPTRESTISGDYIALMPTAPDSGGVINNFLVAAPAAPTNDRYWLVKGDHAFTPKFVFHGSYYHILENEPTSPVISGQLGGGNNFNVHIWEPRLELDQFYSPTFFNVTNFSDQFTEGERIFFPNAPASFLNPTTVGIAGSGNGYPAIDISGYPQFGSGANDGQNSGGCWPCMFISDTARWQHGKNAFSFGTEIRFEDERDVFSINEGTYGFTNGQTSQPDLPAPPPGSTAYQPTFGNQGNSFASFYLGEIDSYSRTGEARNRRVKTGYRALFLQDDIKVNSRLTVNVGVRWDAGIPVHDSDTLSQFANFDPFLANPYAGGLPGSEVYSGSWSGPCISAGGPSYCTNNFIPTYWRDYAPRLGFAYRLNNKTVMRSGYGLFFVRGGAATLYGPVIAARHLEGFQYQQNLPSPDNHISEPAYFANSTQGTWDVGPPPVGTPPVRTRGSEDGQNVDFMGQGDDNGGYTQQWNLTFERELPMHSVIEVSYVGTSGVRLGENLHLPDQAPASIMKYGSVLSEEVDTAIANGDWTGPAFATPNGPYDSFLTDFPGGTVAQALRPFPMFNYIQNNTEQNGHSVYHSLQMKAQKAYSQGLSFLVSYTWAKLLTDTLNQSAGFDGGPLDNAQRRRERLIPGANENAAEGDEVLTATMSYDLPVGPGKKYLNQGPASRIAGGFGFSYVGMYWNGMALDIGGGTGNPIFNGETRPNVIPGVSTRGVWANPSKFNPATDRVLNSEAFADAGAFALGNAPRVIQSTRSFPNLNENLSLVKNTKIVESLNLQIRCDFFNAFNRTIWGNPDGNVGDIANGAFGSVGGQGNSPRQIQFGVRLEY